MLIDPVLFFSRQYRLYVKRKVLLVQIRQKERIILLELAHALIQFLLDVCPIFVYYKINI